MMRTPVVRDLSDSAFDMHRIVWNAIAEWCGGGEYCPVETKADISLAKDLDILAGIDGFQKRPQRGVMRGIASRIQWGDKAWNTFTLRKSRSSKVDTELKKRLWQLAHRHEGYLYPHITVQAYITQRRVGDLLSVALAHTHELIPYAYKAFATLGVFERQNRFNHTGVWEQTSRDEDGSWSTFLAVDWAKYEAAGCAIKQYHCDTQDVLGEP